MLLKDKIILVFYIGCKGMTIQESNKFVVEVRYHFGRMQDDSSELIFIPDYSSKNTHIETLNPALYSEEDYCKLEKAIDTFKQKAKTFIDNEQTQSKTDI